MKTPRFTGITNELAKMRNRDAAERTLTSWIQNSLTLMGLGIALDRISLTLNEAFPNVDLITSQQLATQVALILIAFSIFLLIFAIIQHNIEVKSIQKDNYIFISGRPLLLTTVISISLFGVIGAVLIFLNLL